MTSEVQVFGKDRIRLNILQDVLSGMIQLSFQLDNGIIQDYLSQIHTDGRKVNVVGKFNISEDTTEGDTITIRPIMIDVPLKIMFHANANYSGKKACVVRNATKAVEQEYEISSQTSAIELIPQGKQYYAMKVLYGEGLSATPIQNTSTKGQRKPVLDSKPHREPLAQPTNRPVDVIASTPSSAVDTRFEGFELEPGITGNDKRFESFVEDPVATVSNTGSNITISPKERTPEKVHITGDSFSAPDDRQKVLQQDSSDLQRIEHEITVVERHQEQLSRKKQSAIDHLERIEAEYKKDYASFEQDLEDYKSRMEADASIIEHYKDKDVLPIEIIFREVQLKLEEAEEQIRLFIEAKQRKTMEIESEIKSNKKQ